MTPVRSYIECFLKTMGRPIWEYTSELELLKGFRAALAGHAFLCDQGILHRDISAGNVMLSQNPSPAPGHEGFLIDLELAHCRRPVVDQYIRKDPQSPTTPNSYIQTYTACNSVSVQYGPEFSGTLPFMSIEILKALLYNQPFAHKDHHDIESFIWVFCFAVMRHSITLTPTDDSLKALFSYCFGRSDYRSIMDAKRAGAPMSIRENVLHVSPTVASLFLHLWGLVHASMNPFQPVYLTHTALFEQLDVTIKELSVVV